VKPSLINAVADAPSAREAPALFAQRSLDHTARFTVTPAVDGNEADEKRENARGNAEDRHDAFDLSPQTIATNQHRGGVAQPIEEDAHKERGHGPRHHPPKNAASRMLVQTIGDFRDFGVAAAAARPSFGPQVERERLAHRTEPPHGLPGIIRDHRRAEELPKIHWADRRNLAVESPTSALYLQMSSIGFAVCAHRPNGRERP
jgi:hypothetical protein